MNFWEFFLFIKCEVIMRSDLPELWFCTGHQVWMLSFLGRHLLLFKFYQWVILRNLQLILLSLTVKFLLVNLENFFMCLDMNSSNIVFQIDTQFILSRNCIKLLLLSLTTILIWMDHTKYDTIWNQKNSHAKYEIRKIPCNVAVVVMKIVNLWYGHANLF